MYDETSSRLDTALQTLQDLIISAQLPTIEGIQPHRTNGSRNSRLVNNHINKLVQTYGATAPDADLSEAASHALQKARTQPHPRHRPVQNAWHRKSSIAVLHPEEYSTLSDKLTAKKPKTTPASAQSQTTVSTVTQPTQNVNPDDLATKIAKMIED